MIPIRDTAQSRHYPVVNTALIGINVLVYLYQSGQQDVFVYVYGLVPARYFIPHIADYFTLGQQIFSLLSFMFLHGGFLHLLGNMWTLYIFGDNVEDRLGPFRYLIFYLACGLASGLSHMILNAHSNVPTIGASGAIAGVMGAYFLLYPTARVLTLIPIIIIPWFIEVPAFVFLGLWFVLQFLNAAGSGGGGIAWWAHVGGFVFGMIFLKLFLKLPPVGVTEKVRRSTTKRRTHRLQVVRPAGEDAHYDLYATIAISPFESLTGTHKLVNIPLGFRKRLLRVTVPPRVNQGTRLRLRGQGRPKPDGGRGDLFLKVRINQR
jgi:rhomboid family protein